MPAAERLVQTLQAATGDNPAQRDQVEAYRVFNALYKPSPAGFEEAISIGEKLLETAQASNGQLQLWLACAYGQRFRYRRRGHEGEPVAEDEPDRQNALARLKEAVRLRPDLITLARSLWHPEPGSLENDLAVFQDDSGFQALLA